MQAAGSSTTSWRLFEQSSDRIQRGLALTVLIIAIIWHLWPAVETTPFHRDEARWIGNSALLREWRHPLGERWQDEGYRNVYGTIDEVSRRRSQPPLAMYVFGIGLIFQGEGLPGSGYWIMTQDTDWNAAHGNMPSSTELRAARRTNVAIVLLTVLGLFVIGERVVNRVAGMTAGLAYALHPLVLETSTRAWSDPLLVLCIVAAALASIRFGARPSLRRAAVVGILLGLGGATKLSPLLLAAGLGVLCAFPVAWGVVRKNRTAIWSGLALASIPLAAYLTFAASYPYLWTDPIRHTKRMFDFRSLSFDLQAQASPHARVTGLPDAVRRVGVQFVERDSIGGFLAEKLGSPAVNWDWLHEADLVLAVVGWLLITNLLVRRRFDAKLFFPLTVLGGQGAIIVLAFQLDYARYLLPIVPAIAIGIGAVVGLACSGAVDWVKSNAGNGAARRGQER
jgi:hypothetical protein